ncbi:hypothetical protein HZF05_09650 [Sphingomonas sp. CGMCC 1.13654]|uniref:Uncharacterized protein n=1 Tax=Sphingomonas chungangi TaxID=2683589 RepID=A0A838L6S4_9SPHN|nr:hypothetical protein [Sphingomonas chungangi]MVW57401.1 hypothetical protein [Sphingomonas chungangi]
MRSRPADHYPVTPDGRYFVVRSLLWRRANPRLADDVRQSPVKRLMEGRRAVAAALRKNDHVALQAARETVNAAKVALGERGPVWWEDGEDLNRRLVRNTGYAEWYARLDTGAE